MFLLSNTVSVHIEVLNLLRGDFLSIFVNVIMELNTLLNDNNIDHKAHGSKERKYGMYSINSFEKCFVPADNFLSQLWGTFWPF